MHFERQSYGKIRIKIGLGQGRGGGFSNSAKVLSIYLGSLLILGDVKFI